MVINQLLIRMISSILGLGDSLRNMRGKRGSNLYWGLKGLFHHRMTDP